MAVLAEDSIFLLDDICYWADAPCLNTWTFMLLKDVKEPFFLYLHYMDVHDPYTAPGGYKKFANEYMSNKEFINAQTPYQISKMLYSNGPYVEVTKEDINHMIDLYDDVISYYDKQFGIFLNDLGKKGLLDNTIIVITSDHGEEFLEHDHIMHCRTLFNTVTQVPFIIYLPTIEPKDIRALVQNLDITPTLLDYLGF